jgi:hypothetical protein
MRPPHHPEHQQRETALNAQDLETEAGKNAGADHVSNNDGGPRAKIYLIRLSWHVGKGRAGGAHRYPTPIKKPYSLLLKQGVGLF